MKFNDFELTHVQRGRNMNEAIDKANAEAQANIARIDEQVTREFNSAHLAGRKIAYTEVLMLTMEARNSGESPLLSLIKLEAKIAELIKGLGDS